MNRVPIVRPFLTHRRWTARSLFNLPFIYVFIAFLSVTFWFTPFLHAYIFYYFSSYSEKTYKFPRYKESREMYKPLIFIQTVGINYH